MKVMVNVVDNIIIIIYNYHNVCHILIQIVNNLILNIHVINV